MLKLYRPVKSNFIFQGFGENLACAETDAAGKVIIPYKVLNGSYPNTCPINSVKLYPLLGLKGHNGYDMSAWSGEPVYHSGEFDGWLKSEIDSQGGIGVDVVSNKPIALCMEGCISGTIHYVKLRGWHLKQVIGWDGKQVKMGDLIGSCDSTGISGGNHLHWAPKWCAQDGAAIHEDNGYYGAFDPRMAFLAYGSYFENEFVLDVLATKAAALSAIELARKVIFQVIQFLKGRRNS